MYEVIQMAPKVADSPEKGIQFLFFGYVGLEKVRSAQTLREFFRFRAEPFALVAQGDFRARGPELLGDGIA
jgi:hypothetical protein